MGGRYLQFTLTKFITIFNWKYVRFLYCARNIRSGYGGYLASRIQKVHYPKYIIYKFLLVYQSLWIYFTVLPE